MTRPFLTRSLHQPFLPQHSLPPLALSACLASSLPLTLPPSPCSLPPPQSSCTLLPPSLPPLFPLRPPRHPPSLPLSFLACTPCLCVCHADCIVQRLEMHATKPMDNHSNRRRCFSGALTAGIVSAGRCYLQRTPP